MPSQQSNSTASTNIPKVASPPQVLSNDRSESSSSKSTTNVHKVNVLETAAPSTSAVGLSKTTPPTHKPKPKLHLPRSPLEEAESEDNLQLYKILFDDIFRAWNKQHNFTKDFNTSLVPSRIKAFSQQFAAYFVPTNDSRDQLRILSSEIQHALLCSENAQTTCRMLLVNFRFCLSICIEDKLYAIIQRVAETINKLTAHFLFARELLFQELLIDPAYSTLYQLSQALSLFPFTKLPIAHEIVDETPGLYEGMKYTEIIKIAEKYDVLPSVIIKARDTKRTPEEAFASVKAILETFSRVGQEHLKSVLRFVVMEASFLDLISVDTSYEILNKVWSLLQVMTMDKDWTDAAREDKNDQCFDLVSRLSDLLSMPQSSLSFEKWYLLRRRILNMLGELAQIQLPEKMLHPSQKKVKITYIWMVL
ncbi:MAG: hypothetical protein EXX96DRAFT_272838 [Benjaminiella poitrasii]|nr:MAG: hypothetical protein EXX96DRAFT_272838 [Benjaminiella poitrasii]